MTEAILEARKAYIHNEVPVGGLIVDNTTKSILVRGYNKMNNSLNAINHCEIYLIFNACKKLQSKYLTNTTLFISLEPCMMCAVAISEAHIGKVYFGAYDEKKGGLDNLSITLKQNNFFINSSRAIGFNIIQRSKRLKKFITNFAMGF